MNDVDLGFGFDLDVGFLADCQVLELEEGCLAAFHAGDEALDLLVGGADVVLDLGALVEIGCAVVGG